MTLVEDYEKDQASSGLSGSAYCKSRRWRDGDPDAKPLAKS